MEKMPIDELATIKIIKLGYLKVDRAKTRGNVRVFTVVERDLETI